MLSKVCARAKPRVSCRLAPCKAFFVSGVDVAHYVQQEAVIEGVFHVSAAQSSSCMQRFGDLDPLSAPALPPLRDVLAAATWPAQQSTAAFAFAPSSVGDRVVNEAVCLATPPDNPLSESSSSPLRLAHPLAVRPGTPATANSSRISSSSEGATGFRAKFLCGQVRASPGVLAEIEEVVEEFLQLEGAVVAYHYICPAQVTQQAQVLRASAAVRRQRRRQLLRLLRQSRALTASVAASITASISSLSSCDDEECAVPDDNCCDSAIDTNGCADSSSWEGSTFG